MGWVSGIVVFLLVWWIMLFTVLPFSLKRDETGKPDDPKLKQKFLITTGIALAVWCVIHALVLSDFISFYDMADQMIKEDHLK
jgi:predicted secreted protein